MVKQVLIFFCIVVSTYPDLINLAVLQLDAKGLSETESSILTDRLQFALSQTDRFSIIERQKMQDILKEQGFQQTGCTSNECVVEIGQLLGVQQMLGGSVSKFGGIFSINIKLINVSTGKILKTAVYDHGGKMEDLLTIGINRVVADLLKTETSTPEPVREEKPKKEKIAKSTTSSGVHLFVGAKVGLGMSGLYGDDADATVSGGLGNVTTSSRKAFLPMVFAGMDVGKILGLQLDIIPISMKGENQKYEDSSGYEEEKYKGNYFDISFLINANIPLHAPVTPFAYAGPTLGFLYKSSVQETYDYDGESGADTYNISDETTGMDFGLAFGAGAEMAVGSGAFFGEIRYEFGFISLVKGGQEDIKNNRFALLVGYKKEF